jgi:hypothetical protein
MVPVKQERKVDAGMCSSHGSEDTKECSITALKILEDYEYQLL